MGGLIFPSAKPMLGNVLTLVSFFLFSTFEDLSILEGSSSLFIANVSLFFWSDFLEMTAASARYNNASVGVKALAREGGSFSFNSSFILIISAVVLADNSWVTPSCVLSKSIWLRSAFSSTIILEVLVVSCISFSVSDATSDIACLIRSTR